MANTCFLNNVLNVLFNFEIIQSTILLIRCDNKFINSLCPTFQIFVYGKIKMIHLSYN
jgi:hypothetical protein